MEAGGAPEPAAAGSDAGHITIDGIDVLVIRSARRKRSISASVAGEVIEVRAPARISRRELEPIVSRLVGRLAKRRKKAEAVGSDSGLAERAKALSARYLTGAAPRSDGTPPSTGILPEPFLFPKLPKYTITWSGRMKRRYGSCTPGTGVIKISRRLEQLPSWVLDYVILHELLHLFRADHSAEYWRMVEVYPRWQAARAYLEGYEEGLRVADKPPG